MSLVHLSQTFSRALTAYEDELANRAKDVRADDKHTS
jgi:hypothetical protein